jgi:hypothetical protein
MKNISFQHCAIALGMTLGTLLPIGMVALTAERSDAACRPTGRMVAGRPLLKCTGRTRCRPTGRVKVVRGVRYQILRCPR